jgi:hypothetical protein
MVPPDDQPLATEGELGATVADIARDGIFARPVLIAGEDDTVAVVISVEQLRLLQQGLDDAALEAVPLSDRDLANVLGLNLDDDGTIRAGNG